MRILGLLLINSLCLILSGCGPLAAVSALGSTVTNAAYNQAERDLNNPKPSRDEQAVEVAYANMNLGIEYMRQGDYEKSLFHLKRSILAKSDFAPSYNVLGLLYQKLGDPGSAEDNFKKSINYDPSSSSTYNNYGQFLCNNNRYEEAIKAFNTAANNPLYDSPEIALTNAGLCSLNNDQEMAEDYFVLALNKNPSFPYALLQMSEMSYERNEFVIAHEYFERYKKSARQTPRSLWLGIRICRELNYEDDVSSYALLLRNNYPNTKEAQLLMESYM